MKESRTEFLKLSIGFCHKLADEKIAGPALTLVFALMETWFNTGRHNRHLNPFPLELCDTGRWGLTRMQKSRALKSLVRVKLITVDRNDPKEPWVTLAWEDRYPSKAPHGGNDDL